MPAGRLPRHREVILLWDLIDSAKPGEEVVRVYLIVIDITKITNTDNPGNNRRLPEQL